MKKNMNYIIILGTAVFLCNSCLQNNYEGELPEYIPSSTIRQLDSAPFTAPPGSNTLIIKLTGGEFKSETELAEELFMFTLGGTPRNLGTLVRDSDTQVTASVAIPSGASDCRISVKPGALKRAANRVIGLAVESGVWISAGNSTFGTTRIWTIGYGNGKAVAGGDGGKMAYSTDGITWTAIQPGFNNAQTKFNNTIRGIAYGNGRFVAVGYNGRMAYSDNGIDWSGWDSDKFSGGILCIVYGNGRFVAAGDQGKTAWSTDGITWNAGGDSTFGSNSILHIAYGVSSNRGIFVAAGAGGKMAYSWDARTWTSSEGGFDGSAIYGITYGNGTFVAVGDSGKIRYSTTGGTSWSSANSSRFGSTGILGLAFGSGIFLLAGHNNKIATSRDGQTWDADMLSGNDGQIGGICYGGDKFILGANEYTSGTSRIVYGYGAPALGNLEPDDKVSEPFTSLPGNNMMIITLQGGAFKGSLTVGQFALDGIALGIGYTLNRDSDTQVTISGPTLTSSQHTIKVLQSAQASRSSRIILRTETRILWNTTTITGSNTPFSNNEIRGIAYYGSSSYIAVGENGTIAKYNDTNWTQVNTGTNGPFNGWGNAPALYSAAYGSGNVVVAVGENGNIIRSADSGATWTVINTGKAGPFSGWGNAPVLYSVAHGSRGFMAVGQWGAIVRSSDGTSWGNAGDIINPVPGGNLYSIAYGSGNIAVAVGEDGTIIRSADSGATWTVINTGKAGPFKGWLSVPKLYSLTYGGGNFVAVGQWGTILRSPDGISWTLANTGTTSGPFNGLSSAPGLYSLAYSSGNAVFVTGGDNGRMAKSSDGLQWTLIPTGTTSAESPFVAEECIRAICFGTKFILGGNRYGDVRDAKQSKIAYQQ